MPRKKKVKELITELKIDCFGNEIEEKDEDIPEKNFNQELSVFDILNDISKGGNIVDNYKKQFGHIPSNYSNYIANKFFANYIDTLSYANLMNQSYEVPDEIQYLFYKLTIKPRKRYTKWFKEIEPTEPLELLANYFHCSKHEIQKNLMAFNKEELNKLIEKLEKEGN